MEPEQELCACKHLSANRCLLIRLPNVPDERIGEDECGCECHAEILRRMDEEDDERAADEVLVRAHDEEGGR